MLLAYALMLFADVKPAPVLSAGSSPEFQSACLAVEQRLAKGDFAGAAKLAKLLPKQEVTVGWDDSKVPAAWRKAFALQRDGALRTWTGVGVPVHFHLGAPADIQIGFGEKLATDAATGLPLGAAVFMNDKPAPRVEEVIGLQRGNPPQPTNGPEVHNDVAHAVGRYFGLASTPIFGTLASRTDLPTTFLTIGFAPELAAVTKNLRAVAFLREAIAKKWRLNGVGRPSVFINPDPRQGASAGSVLQGKPAQFSFQITNKGTAPLSYRMHGDCGCVEPDAPGTIAPGGSAIIHPLMDTTGYEGPVHKNLILYTNDTDRSGMIIPLSVNVVPRFRFIHLGGDAVSVDDDNRTQVVYLALPKNADLDLEGAQFDGVPADVQMEPWHGMMPDPEMNEPAKERNGYMFTIQFKDPLPEGQANCALVVSTTDRQMPRLRYHMTVQHGIAASPSDIFLGQLTKDGNEFRFLVNRPGKPFHVLEATSDTSDFTAKFAPVSDTEYKVTVTYDGKGVPGDVDGHVLVRTDDPKQPLIKVPFHGIVQ